MLFASTLDQDWAAILLLTHRIKDLVFTWSLSIFFLLMFAFW